MRPELPTKPVPEQIAVIHEMEPRFCVVASAGAGKTGVLVERYLKHVRDGMRADQVLTITFTRKAAFEMKRRIVTRLLAEGLNEEAQIAETGPIQTIHGFCERLLRENALEAGLDPEFEILSDEAAARIKDACIREALGEPAENVWADALLTRLAGVAEHEARGPHSQLEGAIRECLSGLRGSGADLEQLTRVYGDPSSALFHWQRELLGSLPEEVRRFHAAGAKGEPFFNRLRAAYAQAELKPPRWLSNKVDPALDQQAAEYACGLMWFALGAWASFEREMQRRQALDFVALEEQALRLLQSSKRTVERVQEQYRAVMVDESQDVNPLQHKLLDSLGIETEMLVGDPQQSIYGFRQADLRLFKERLDARHKLRLQKNHRSDIGIQAFVDDLFCQIWPDSYQRMAPSAAPMRFEEEPEGTDAKAQDKAKDAALPRWAGVEVWLQREDDPCGVARYVKELRDSGNDLGRVAVLVRRTFYGIRLDAALKQLGVPSRVAGGTELFYARLEIRDLANALCAVADPYQEFALLATLRSPFCGLSIDSIATLARRPPAYEALRSFEAPVTDDAPKLAAFLAWFEPLARYADRLAAWEVLSELFAKSGYLEALARRRNADQLLANVRKLLSLAAQDRELGPSEYAEQIREIQDLRHREGDAPAEDDSKDLVTIMTIHKAKGLEFDTVIVPETHYKLQRKARETEVDGQRGMVVPKLSKTPSPFHTWIAENKRRADIEEEYRILYVALTRARHRLCVVAHPLAKAQDCFARTIYSRLGLSSCSAGEIVIRDSQDVQQMRE